MTSFLNKFYLSGNVTHKTKAGAKLTRGYTVALLVPVLPIPSYKLNPWKMINKFAAIEI